MTTDTPGTHVPGAPQPDDPEAGSVLDRIAGVITGHPRIVLGVLFAVIAGLTAGMALVAEQADSSVFLPDDSDVAQALETMAEEFPESAGLTNITIVHRGDVLTPTGLDHVDRVLASLLADPAVEERLAVTNPVSSLAAIYQQALGVEDLSTVSQSEIDGITSALADNPDVADVVDGLVGEANGEGLATSSLRLRPLDDAEGLVDLELEIADMVEEVEGPLDVRTLSAATTNEESAEDSSTTTQLFMALGVIVALLFLFFRTGSDVLLAMVGLGATVLGTSGFQGIMGPEGLGFIGQPTQITTMVPIMLIGLVVDYAIQSVSHYRELRIEGHGVAAASRRGLRIVALPLGLAAGTTIISFLTNVFSPIPANQDFAWVASFGVLFGLVTMLTLVPAARAILDERAEAKGTLRTPNPIAGAIPGAGAFVERVGVFVARKPMAVLVGAGVVTIVLGAAATNISTVFDQNDFLASDGDTRTDLEDIEEAVGGQTETVTVLAELELTDDRNIRNLLGLDEAFADERSRPTGAASDITSSVGLLVQDWIEDSGQPGDKYDPDLITIAQEIDQGVTLDPDGLQRLLDRVEELDPITFAQVAVNNPDGEDVTLVQFDGLTGDQDRLDQMVDDVEGLWYGDRDQITVTSGEIIGLAVTESMTDSQTTSIALTVVAALIVLVLFFWASEFKPMLAPIAVFPILLVLVWVLGTMTLLDISYNIVTALITALSIGIGVDYTIHVIHRFTEELKHGRSVEDATTTTLSTTGSALIGSALTTALGFGVLLFSPLVPFQQFGIVTAITILYALIAAIVVVPPLLVVWAAYHQWRQEQSATDEGLFGTTGR